MLTRLSENGREVESRLLCVYPSQEVADEALDLVVQLFRVEAPHDAETDHMRVYHVLLHLLSFVCLFRLLNLELGVLCDSLYDSQRNSSVFLNIILTEVLKSILNVLSITHVRRAVGAVTRGVWALASTICFTVDILI